MLFKQNEERNDVRSTDTLCPDAQIRAEQTHTGSRRLLITRKPPKNGTSHLPEGRRHPQMRCFLQDSCSGTSDPLLLSCCHAISKEIKGPKLQTVRFPRLFFFQMIKQPEALFKYLERVKMPAPRRNATKLEVRKRAFKRAIKTNP